MTTSSIITRRLRVRATWIVLLLVASGLIFLMMPGCAVIVAGQKVPDHVLAANADNFNVADDVTALHYYGVGGWGVQWRGQYLLMAPYFSNHGFVGLFRKNGPDLDAVRKGVNNTPFADAGLILVGHGHVDHAADIPAYPAAGLPARQAGVIANETTLNMLAELMPPNESFRCAVAARPGAAAIDGCALSGFRITPLPSHHAPNVKILGKGFTIAKGTVDEPQAHIPERPSRYLAGETWAYVIDLLDEEEEIVFRIHYMDAVAGADQGSIPESLLAQRAVDIHIACVPGFAYVRDYPEWALEQGNAGYVLLGHWEDFFQSRDKRLKPVTYVLSENKLNEFVLRIENGITSDARQTVPLNKSADECPAEAELCGPRGNSWAMPVPGETYHFRTEAAP